MNINTLIVEKERHFVAAGVREEFSCSEKGIIHNDLKN